MKPNRFSPARIFFPFSILMLFFLASCSGVKTSGNEQDDAYYSSVIQVFIDLYKKGHIYRGKRMINWDVKAKTALSDEEVIYKEVNSKLYHVNYRVEGDDTAALQGITIATVRPETILGDAAICVHPSDTRYQHLVGRFALVP